MMRINRFATLAVLAAAALAGCDTARPVADAEGRCTGCHGGAANQTGAPPVDRFGRVDSPPVGAHTSHLASGVPCGSCHVVPASASEPGHIGPRDLPGGAPGTLTPTPGDVILKELAAAGGAAPAYDYATRTCNGTYCHGATLPLNERPAPQWNQGAVARCVQCHGFPPASHGPLASPNCAQCHPTPVDLQNPGEDAPLVTATHLNGVADFELDLAVASSPEYGCRQCHGYPPPPNARTDVAHPQASDCSRCHADVVGGAENEDLIDLAKHMNGVVNITGGHAVGFVVPQVHGPQAIRFFGNDPSALVCTDCHGADFGGGTSGVSCNACHAAVSNVPDWTTNCTFCHGTQTPGWTAAQLRLSAPPEGVAGATDPSDPSVGAHQAHLQASQLTATPISCSTCHVVPPASLEGVVTHIDATRAQVQFSGRANERGTSSSFGGASCTTYCHGARAPGAVAVAGPNHQLPLWTDTQIACDSCHGSPPPSHTAPNLGGLIGRHGQAPCGSCHVGYVAGTTVNLPIHLNGAPEVVFEARAGGTATFTGGWIDCRACHDVNANAPALP